MQNPVNEKDVDDMSKINTNTRNARIMRCFECNEEGHIRPECPQLRQRNNYRMQNNFYRNNNNERRNNNNRNINLMDYERYYDNNRYNDNEYYNDYEIYNYEKEMYPTLRSGKTYNRNLNDDYNEMEIEDVPIPPKREYDMKMDIDECPNPGMKRENKNIRVRVNVLPEKYVIDMFNEKANITYGQIYNENPKFRRIARDYDENGSV
ncbi:unnamed protein product [Rhizophagus irregularis]|nr:unnamed protein product [Rhizophagus irregularis]